jgi:hypothetical protein
MNLSGNSNGTISAARKSFGATKDVDDSCLVIVPWLLLLGFVGRSSA